MYSSFGVKHLFYFDFFNYVKKEIVTKNKIKFGLHNQRGEEGKLCAENDGFIYLFRLKFFLIHVTNERK
ncbi:hypothetical protein CN585_30015 [Bacillus toyonensis]|uniref:Uncharacterized protein n=1 Tax=Bacillus toyonensis TaxID=155322 RepID=A0A2A8H3R2_9BACI|nr:hypothetical protein CN585_30015 [Bacillus toyonensis]